MATKKLSDVFAEPIEEVAEVEETIATPAPAEPGLKKARIKGTWVMYWGRDSYNFEDGKSFNIPADLFEYLKAHGNIYDTLQLGVNMAAKKTVSETNTVTAVALEDLNIIWGSEVLVAAANSPIEVSYGLYDHLVGRNKVSGGVHHHTPAVVPTVETIDEVETATEEDK